MLRAESLVKNFQNRLVVDHVSLILEKGEIVGLLGPNGAGKTTTFNMLVGIIKPDQGHIYINGDEITSKPIYERVRLGMGYLPQESTIFRRLTVAENLKLACQVKGFRNFESERLVNQFLERFRLEHVKDSYGYQLSGGERRRCELARALILDPIIMLLDEPFAGVDPIAVGEIQKTINEIKNQGIGIIITDHNVRETLRICDRAYLLYQGKVQVSGTVEDILNNDLAKKFYLGTSFSL